jgi:hypothetical protein
MSHLTYFPTSAVFESKSCFGGAGIPKWNYCSQNDLCKTLYFPASFPASLLSADHSCRCRSLLLLFYTTLVHQGAQADCRSVAG